MLFKRQKNTFSLNVLEDLDEEILSRLERMNIDRRQARKYITSNQHNTVTTTYYLLLKQKLLAGGTIITADMLSKQPMYPVQTQPAPVPQQVSSLTPAPVIAPNKQPLRLNNHIEPIQVAPQQPVHLVTPQSMQVTPQQPVKSTLVESLQTTSSSPQGQPRANSPVASVPEKPQVQPSPIVIKSQRRIVQIEHQQSTVQEELALVRPVATQSFIVEDTRKTMERVDFCENNLMTKSEEVVSYSVNPKPKLETVEKSKTSTAMPVDVPPADHFKPKSKEKVDSERTKSQNKVDEQEKLMRVTSAGSGVKLLNLTVNKYAKTKTEDQSSSKGQITQRENSDLKQSDTSMSAKVTSQNRRSEKSSGSISKKPTSPIPQPKPAKMNNIYMNLKRFTSSSKVESATSKRSKGSTKSSSHSREKITFMRTYDASEKWAAGTSRKISNPSFQSTSAEDSNTKSLAIIKRGKENEIRKTRNPFSLDFITEKDPTEILKEVVANLRAEKIPSISKVERDNHRGRTDCTSLQASRQPTLSKLSNWP